MFLSARSNIELFAHYGFALLDNPFNEAAVCLSVHPKQGPNWEQINQTGQIPPLQVGLIGLDEDDFIPAPGENATTSLSSNQLYNDKMSYIKQHFTVLNPTWGGCEGTEHRLFRCKLTPYVHDTVRHDLKRLDLP